MAAYSWQLIRQSLAALCITALTVASLLSIVIFFRSAFLDTYPDFRVYYPAAVAYIQERSPYYADETFFTNFSYPPSIAQIFTPFTLLSLGEAERVWTAINFLLWFSALIVLIQIVRVPLFSLKSLWLVGMACLFFPAKFTVGMGQINIVLLFLLSLSLWYAINASHKISGVLAGATVSLKLFPILLLILAVFSRSGRTAVVYAISTILLTSIASIVLTPDLWRYFIFELLPALGVSLKSDYYNQTLLGLLLRLFSPDMAYQLWILTTGAAVITAVSIILKYRPSLPAILALSIPLSLAFQTFAWQHLYVTTLASFAYLVLLRPRSIVWYTCIASVYILCAINSAAPQKLPVLLQYHQLFGALMLTGLCIWSIIQRYGTTTYNTTHNRADRRHDQQSMDRPGASHSA